MSSAFDPARNGFLDEDSKFIESFLLGDQTAFDQLYVKYYEKAFAIAKGVLLNEEEAHDATQEIFTLVHRNLKGFDRRSKFSTWLYRIAVNRSIQYSRASKRHTNHAPLTEAHEQIAPEQTSIPDPAIEQAMGILSPEDRAVLTLFYWDELSLSEIGESLGVTENAAKTRLFRARDRFKAHYLREGGI